MLAGCLHVPSPVLRLGDCKHQKVPTSCLVLTIPRTKNDSSSLSHCTRLSVLSPGTQSTGVSLLNADPCEVIRKQHTAHVVVDTFVLLAECEVLSFCAPDLLNFISILRYGQDSHLSYLSMLSTSQLRPHDHCSRASQFATSMWPLPAKLFLSWHDYRSPRHVQIRRAGRMQPFAHWVAFFLASSMNCTSHCTLLAAARGPDVVLRAGVTASNGLQARDCAALHLCHWRRSDCFAF